MHQKVLRIPAVEKITFLTDHFFAPIQHSHDYIELAYITKGKALHFLDGTTILIEKGDYFFVDYNSEHSLSQADENDEFEIINCMFKPTFFDSRFVNVNSFKDLIESKYFRIESSMLRQDPAHTIYHDNDGTILGIIKKMLVEHEKQNIGYEEIIRSYLTEIIVLSMRKISVSRAKFLHTNRKEFILQYIVGYIEHNYMNDISLSTLSKEFNYSAPHLSKLIKKELGMSYSNFLTKVRINKAVLLLTHTNKKISEIASLVGYNDERVFSRRFKQFRKVTPRDFRQNYHNGKSV